MVPQQGPLVSPADPEPKLNFKTGLLDIPRPGSLAPSVWPRLWTRPDVGVGKVCWDISQHGGALEGSFRGAVLFDTFVCFHLDLACLDRNPIAYASLDVGTRANPANQPVSDPLPYIAG